MFRHGLPVQPFRHADRGHRGETICRVFDEQFQPHPCDSVPQSVRVLLVTLPNGWEAFFHNGREGLSQAVEEVDGRRVVVEPDVPGGAGPVHRQQLHVQQERLDRRLAPFDYLAAI